MLFIVDRTSKTAVPANSRTFAELRMLERYDIQEWVIANPELLGEELLVVSSEFAGFGKTAERLDVLAVDPSGRLVVVELKRSAVGTSADLQALRYAAYCSTLGLEDVAELLQRHLAQRREEAPTLDEARAQLTAFIQREDFQDFDDKPRIILAAEKFPPEIMATVMWLRSYDLDISVVRLSPYQVGDDLVIDSTVLIPLPEAEEYIIRRETKEERSRERQKGKGEAYRAWFQTLVDELREAHDFTNARAAQPMNWSAFSPGTSGTWWVVTFARAGLRIELYIDTKDGDRNNAILDRLLAQRAEIEEACGFPLSWERLEGKRAVRIGVYRDTTIESPREELDEARQWAIQGLLTFERVLGPRLPGVVG